MGKAYKILVERLKRDLGVDVRITIQCILKNEDVKVCNRWVLVDTIMNLRFP
jgi:hypothetical protein